jgi:hypothetical protein
MTFSPTAIRNSASAVVALILFGRASSPAQSQARRVLRHESERQVSFHYEGGAFMPVWEGRALLGIQGSESSDEPIIVCAGRDGQTERIGFSFPGGRYLNLSGLAAGRDGSIAVVGGAYSNEGQPGTFLARIAPDRSRKVIVQLWPYVAFAVTISSDGSMWTVGYVKRADNLGESEFNVLRRFDSSGKLLATRSVKAQGRYVHGRDATQTSLLKSSNDRVGWLTNANEYIEFGLDGSELGRFGPPPGPAPEAFETTIALGDHNEVLAGTRYDDGLKVWSLERKERSWKPVTLTGGSLTRWATLGFDGDTVVVIEHTSPYGATLTCYTFSAAE